MQTADISKITTAGAVTAMQVNVGVNPSANNSNNDSGGSEPSEEEKAIQAQAAADAEKYKGLSPEEITAKKEEEKAAAEAEKNKLPELTEEQRSTLLKQALGDDFDGNIEAVKLKLKGNTAAAELTPEEKAKIEADWDKRQLDVYVAAGGTIDAYAAAKKILEMDVSELSIADIKEELKSSGIPEDQHDSIIQARYFKFNIDELEQGGDETEAEFEARKALIQKQIDFGKKKLESRGNNLKTKADKFFKDLRKSIEESEKQKKELDDEESQISSTVDEVISKFPRKVTFELGKVNDADVAPVEHEVSESDMEEVRKLLKDPTERNNILFKEDNSLNVSKIAEILIENRYLKSAAKRVYSEGVTRTVDFYKSKFGGQSPHEIGIGSNGKQTDGVKGRIVTAGQPQPSRRPVPAT